MRTVIFKHDDFETTVVETCEGCTPRVLLIHGIDCTKEIFFMYPAIFPFIDFIMYDQRGFGTGIATDGDYHFDKFVQDALAVYDAFRPDYVIGHSFGGVMSQEVCVNRKTTCLAMQTTARTPWFEKSSPSQIKALFDNAKLTALNTFFLNTQNIFSFAYVLSNLNKVLHNPAMPAMEHANEFLNFGNLCPRDYDKPMGVIGGNFDEIVPRESINYLASCIKTTPVFLDVPHLGVIFPNYVFYTVNYLASLNPMYP